MSEAIKEQRCLGGLPNETIFFFLKDMFVAGTDISLATLEWTTTELARNLMVMVMEKAQEEVRNIASSTGKVEESHL
ncbi:Cytochrome P450 93A2 [Morella rubra]|uniref:Cytochrome P450 93A2 n=1 Tax=Morella rubra TaxID=262757 RepID=A0A6A1VJD9_9ROSI|nr:Cytochrome P450 93A2 [Morella rubra]